MSVKKCNKGHNADCCCNCKHQRKLNKSPCNTDAKIDGSISEFSGYYACLCPELDVDIIYDKEHGMCEMHYPK